MRINPRDFHQRRLTAIPPHFVKTELALLSEPDIELIARWVYQHCYGRFGITKNVGWTQDRPHLMILLGFEEPSDLTLFALSDIAHKNIRR